MSVPFLTPEWQTDLSQGKSSVLNSLFGIPNIAPQSDEGKACTSVVQEFHKPRSDQQHACEAEIFFLTPSARIAILKEWLKDFYIFKHSDIEPGDEVFEKFEQASTTAVEGLFSLFCDRDECQDHDSVKQFLSTARGKDDEGMVSKLKSWTDDLLARLGADSGKISITDTSPVMVQYKISQYLQHMESSDEDDRSGPSPWPFVKLVKYDLYCNAHYSVSFLYP